jgi:hypothetical protein
MRDVSGLLGTTLVITEKLDGANVCLCHEAVFARSHSSPAKHPAVDYVKAFHARIKTLLTPGESVFCEYCYAVHTIEYEGLPAYLFVIGIRNDVDETWFSWRETSQVAEALGITTVPVLAVDRCQTEAELIALTIKLATSSGVYGEREGIVVRSAGKIHERDFNKQCAKWVRAGHVQSDEHWMSGPIRKQRLVSG